MCYPKPGPRCSAHAAKKLADLKARRRKIIKFKGEGDLNKLNQEIEQAEKDYSITPAGISELARRARHDLQNGGRNSSYKEQLMEAVFTRQEALAAIKTKDLGDLKNHSLQDTELEWDKNSTDNYAELLKYSNEDLTEKKMNKLVNESNKWLTKLTPDEIEAAAYFTSNGSTVIAKHLTGTSNWDKDWDDPEHLDNPERLNTVISRLDSALEKSVHRNPVKVFRGLNHEIVDQILGGESYRLSEQEAEQKIRSYYKTGENYTPPTFLSASVNLNVAEGFARGSQRIILEVNAIKAGPVTNVSAWSVSEQEYILPRKANYTIRDIEKVHTDGRTYFIVKMDETATSK